MIATIPGLRGSMIVLLGAAVALFLGVATTPAWAVKPVGPIPVDCDDGDSLQEEINEAKTGSTLVVTGTCNERIIIATDNLTLDGSGVDGSGVAVIDGDTVGGTTPLVRVFATNVTIKGFTIQDGPGIGLNVGRSGSAIIENNTVQNNTSHGILINNGSYARIGEASGDLPHSTPGSQGNTITGNGTHGITINTGGAADIAHNLVDNNDFDGILLTGSSADIDANVITNNGLRGLRLRLNASVRLDTDGDHGELGERNLIQGNDRGIECRTGGALEGEAPDFGTGNTNPNRNQDDSCVERVSGFAFP